MIAFIAMACNQKEDHLTNDSSESIFQLNSEWENQEGEFIKLSDLKGNTLVMVMIYTSCKTACPRLTGEMREIEKKLGKETFDKAMQEYYRQWQFKHPYPRIHQVRL